MTPHCLMQDAINLILATEHTPFIMKFYIITCVRKIKCTDVSTGASSNR